MIWYTATLRCQLDLKFECTSWKLEVPKKHEELNKKLFILGKNNK